MIAFRENLYRGPHPTHDDLRDTGMRATLDLESGAQVIGDNSPLEEAMMGEGLDVRVYPHPLGGILPPTVNELKQSTIFLVRQEAHGVRTLVHCCHGVDRTGMVVAAFRVLAQNWRPFDAAWECIHGGMHLIYLPWLIQLWRLK